MLQIQDLEKKIKGKIAIVDFGGQYCHLIASRIRRLGAYTEIVLPENILKNIKSYKGIILSGGPDSVYDTKAPSISDEIFQYNLPILGICYGHQYLMYKLGGTVSSSNHREYGKALLKIKKDSLILKDVKKETIVWMSHGDEVTRIPNDFEGIASTQDCQFAVVENKEKKIYGLQFHPEVIHTEEGNKILKNFIKICNLEYSWSIENYLQELNQYLKEKLKDKKVFFLVSGGVDSTVAFFILSKILKNDQLYGMLIDTGFLRYKEAEQIKQQFLKLGINLLIEDAKDIYYERLKNIVDPEQKRKIIGDLFIEIQQNVVKKLNLNTQEWLLGQGTIYPDTIESGSTKFSHTIKTHHNRVPIIQEMIEKGLVVEPLRDLYKDEVREIGLLSGLSPELIFRHPFPGPGLAVRCLCNDSKKGYLENIENDLGNHLKSVLKKYGLHVWKLPIQSVGVQGDKRTYSHPAILIPENLENFFSYFEWEILLEIARQIPNQLKNINRVVLGLFDSHTITISKIQLMPNRFLESYRIEILQKIDNLVYEFMKEKEIYKDIWQNPVVLLPISYNNKNESIVIRPVCSLDAMTASVYEMPKELLRELINKIYNTNLISLLMYDLTTKPPGTIEWE